jgi:hypothetical protein
MLEVIRSIQLKKQLMSHSMVEEGLHEKDENMVEVGVPALEDLARQPTPSRRMLFGRTVGHINNKISLRQTRRRTIDQGIDIAAKLSAIEGRDAAEENNPRTASLLPQGLLRVSLIPTEIVAPVFSDIGGGSRKNSLNSEDTAVLTLAEEKRRRRELSRLDIFLPDAATLHCGMRTRSADSVGDESNAAMRTLRSAFKFVRQVSDSFTSMF